jgi:hypothetical protein
MDIESTKQQDRSLASFFSDTLTLFTNKILQEDYFMEI